jgi:hypothetical protein
VFDLAVLPRKSEVELFIGRLEIVNVAGGTRDEYGQQQSCDKTTSSFYASFHAAPE